MSHFIEGVDNLLNGPIFKFHTAEIVKPRMKRYLKSNTLENLLNQENDKKILNHLVSRYSQIETQKFRNQNENLMQQRCQNLKKKFKSSFNPNANGKSVDSFFIDETMSIEEKLFRRKHLNLRNLTEDMPKIIDLEKNYHTQLNLKMIAIQQAKQIANEKQNRRNKSKELYNNIESSNFRKMTFLLQKISEKKKLFSNSKHIQQQSKNKIGPSLKLQIQLQKTKNKTLFDINLSENNHKSYSKKKKFASKSKMFLHRQNMSINDDSHYYI